MIRNSIIGAAVEAAIPPVGALVTICAQQKRHKPDPGVTPAALNIAPLADLAAQWRRIVADEPTAATAADLYGGRAFGLARDAAAVAPCRLYVISAGLGLIDAETPSPAYGLTISPNATESLQGKVEGRFAADDWFEQMLSGPYSTDWDTVFERGPGEVLVALTRPYAEMVGPSLARLPQHHLDRLRVFGAGLKPVLPKRLHDTVAPYDDRLDTIFPGTRSDFAQRAMVHYVEHIARSGADRKALNTLVLAALAPVETRVRVIRQGASDIALLALIKARLGPKASASRLLRQLRDDDGIACEQGRFARLFRQAQVGETLQ
jgi:hypothetical protein